jgi:L-iditol 2-dehydrogenase
VLLRVRGVGLCGSDLHYYLEGAIGSAVIREPFIMGHEIAAELTEPHGNLPAGTLVAVDPNHPCGHCEQCEQGYVNLCPNHTFLGAPPTTGAMAEYLVAPVSTVIPVPSHFDAATVVALEPLGIAIHALDLARLRPMESVAVLGAGPIGLLLTQVARASGAGDLFVIDPLAYRQQAALEMGATRVAASHHTIAEWTKGRGVDVVLEATNSPLGPQHAAEAVRIGGRLVLVGIPEGGEIGFNASLVRRKGLSIKLSRRMGHTYPRAIQMVERGLVRFESLITHRIGLNQIPQAFDDLAAYRNGALKIVADPNA